MTAAPPTLEQRLVQGYRQQLRHYDHALAIVNQQAPPTSAMGHWAQDLDAVLQSVGTIDAALAEDKSAWRRSGAQPGPELAALLDQLANRLGMLAQIIKAQVAELETRSEQLMPEMDALIQQRRMLNAYGAFGDRHAHVAKRS